MELADKFSKTGVVRTTSRRRFEGYTAAYKSSHVVPLGGHVIKEAKEGRKHRPRPDAFTNDARYGLASRLTNGGRIHKELAGLRSTYYAGSFLIRYHGAILGYGDAQVVMGIKLAADKVGMKLTVEHGREDS